MNDVYTEGYDAFHQGYIPIDCPYQEGTYAHAEWQLGYQHAEEECPVYGDAF